ncbi:hypothetical protein BDW42DRAFT_111157 [Aspergillus taichungensis]|uniref:Uncharacterized protein n=1 Tax=Aspergillus taichungensis TaxID=482145 RepID=A0A2J5HT54_9EURO|nr:hypothetical protein BDW42DRAFT_111157 [Aspergillus taichungensis]
MKPSIPFLLFLTNTLLPASATASQPNPAKTDAYTLDYFQKVGACFLYTGKGGDREKAISPCKAWCPAHEGKDKQGIGCYIPGITTLDNLDPSIFLKDEQGHEYIPGKCVCENPQKYLPLVEPVMDSLSKLDDILCGVFLESFKTIAMFGLNTIFGSQAEGLRLTVDGTKGASGTRDGACRFLFG